MGASEEGVKWKKEMEKKKEEEAGKAKIGAAAWSERFSADKPSVYTFHVKDDHYYGEVESKRKGDMLNRNLHGYGTYNNGYGDIQEGSFKNGQMHGVVKSIDTG